MLMIVMVNRTKVIKCRNICLHALSIGQVNCPFVTIPPVCSVSFDRQQMVVLLSYCLTDAKSLANLSVWLLLSRENKSTTCSIPADTFAVLKMVEKNSWGHAYKLRVSCRLGQHEEIKAKHLISIVIKWCPDIADVALPLKPYYKAGKDALR